MKQYKSWHTAGEMNTRVIIEAPVQTKDAYGQPATSWQNVFGEGVYIKCRWINSHGNDVYTAYHQELREPAKVLLRYDPLITHLCQIKIENDPLP